MSPQDGRRHRPGEDAPAGRSDQPARSLDRLTLVRLVSLLCNARLACLLVLAIVAARSGAAEYLGLIVLAMLPSWLPIWYWTRKPQMFAHAARFCALDVLVAYLVFWLAVVVLSAWPLGIVQLLLSAGLWGALLRPRTAIALSAGVALLASPILLLHVEPWVTLLIVPAAAGVALGTTSLAVQMHQQGTTALKLIEAKSAMAAQEERALLAREMHDSLAKTLHGVNLLMASLTESLREEGSDHVPLAEKTQEACAVASSQARAVLGDLRAPVESSVVQMVYLECRRWESAQHLPVRIDVDESVDDHQFPEETIFHVQRILAELLENVARHARANSVEVTLTVDADTARLRVADDGRGMPDLDTDELSLQGHYGLLGITERAELLGADVVSATGLDGRGTSVTLSWPLRGADGAERSDLLLSPEPVKGAVS